MAASSGALIPAVAFGGPQGQYARDAAGRWVSPAAAAATAAAAGPAELPLPAAQPSSSDIEAAEARRRACFFSHGGRWEAFPRLIRAMKWLAGEQTRNNVRDQIARNKAKRLAEEEAARAALAATSISPEKSPSLRATEASLSLVATGRDPGHVRMAPPLLSLETRKPQLAAFEVPGSLLVSLFWLITLFAAELDPRNNSLVNSC
jgi:hypothetical protein